MGSEALCPPCRAQRVPLGRKPEALKELETALKLRPKFPQAKKDFERLSKG